MSTKAAIPLLLTVATLAAGCGGGGGADTGGGGETIVTGDVNTNSTLYESAYGICSSADPKQLQNDYYLDSTDPGAIAQAVAASLSGGNPADEPNVAAGCLAGLEAYEG